LNKRSAHHEIRYFFIDPYSAVYKQNFQPSAQYF